MSSYVQEMTRKLLPQYRILPPVTRHAPTIYARSQNHTLTQVSLTLQTYNFIIPYVYQYAPILSMALSGARAGPGAAQGA